LKALELDESLPQAHAMMGVLHANKSEWKEAELSFHRALQLGPESVESYTILPFLPYTHEAL